MKLIDFAKNEYSQNGEDGILKEILLRLNWLYDGIACEFGASDGLFMSNTFNLIENYKWHGIYIESDQILFNKLKLLSKSYPAINPINEIVELSGKNLIDNILRHHCSCIDLISIDIDGYDYQVWESMKKFSPTIVVIEINSSIPVGIEQIHNLADGKQGSSFTSMLKLGISKGYSLVCHTGNMIFIKDEFINKFQDIEINADSLFLTKWLKK